MISIGSTALVYHVKWINLQHSYFEEFAKILSWIQNIFQHFVEDILASLEI